MTQVSRFKLKDHVLERLFDLFFEIVGKNKSREEFTLIINDVLSSTEKIMIAKRIAIVYLLLKGIDYRNFCKTIKVSSATVSKYKILVERSGGLVPAFEKIIRDDKIVEFLEGFLIMLFPPGTPGINWSAAWQVKIEHERSKKEGI